MANQYFLLIKREAFELNRAIDVFVVIEDVCFLFVYRVNRHSLMVDHTAD